MGISECHEINTVLKLTDYWKKSGWGRWATVVLNDMEQTTVPGVKRVENNLQGTAFNCHFTRRYLLSKSWNRNTFISDFKKCQKMRTTRHAADAVERITSSIRVVERRRRMAQREFSSRRDSPVMVRLLEQIIAAQDK